MNALNIPQLTDLRIGFSGPLITICTDDKTLVYECSDPLAVLKTMHARLGKLFPPLPTPDVSNLMDDPVHLAAVDALIEDMSTAPIIAKYNPDNVPERLRRLAEGPTPGFCPVCGMRLKGGECLECEIQAAE
jgi:hypothetical protein